ncbi:Beta-galactosidase [Mycena indigotica]|uniref:Beta-galactosidase n=1 Tax=Mycena indigotica TaxID=2126181 RepID=A0A8H6W8V0_9AGAR|nr:Beta-galactosidase [Mycena indigotica]KAF7307336.1 Beta-galactosidase [Mycena indigotica]
MGAALEILSDMHFLLVQLLHLVALLAKASGADAARSNNGLTQAVEWDDYSFFLLGNRTFIQSGEFHMWRLPSPSLWPDIVQKVKAGGLNTISVYFHWGLSEPRPGVVDLTGINDFQPFLDAAKKEGIWVIARPGPYINSETSRGGIPGHVAWLPGNPPWNPYNGELRSNDTFYHDAWQDYWTEVIGLVARNQITNGGPIILLQIENEYYNGPGQNEYVGQLKQRAIDLGVVVPTFVNDPGEFQNLVNDTDLYAIDAYPLSASNCGNANPAIWRDIVTNWRSYFDSVVPGKPHFFPEFQGGSADNWGSTGGYENCRKLINTNFQRVFYHQMWSSGVTAENFYMVYGGTTWAQLPYSQGYTSYDYSAPIDEQRQITAKHAELKLQSLFLRSFPDFYMTDLVVVDNSTVSKVYATHLKNPAQGSSFYIFRPNNVTLNETLNFRYTIGQNNITIPQNNASLTLLGRDSFVIATDLVFGSSKLKYSTASILTSLELDGSDLLVVYGNAGLSYEISLNLAGPVRLSTAGPTKVTTLSGTSSFTINFMPAAGLTLVRLSPQHGIKPITILIADYDAATRLWQPSIQGAGTFSNYVHYGASTPLLISGPYLVRNASLQGSHLSLWGDVPESTAIQIFGPASLSTLQWNGSPLRNLKKMSDGVFAASISFVPPPVSLPNLQSATWKFRDSLPEVQPDFDGFGMIPADQTTTTSVFPPYYGQPWILYGDMYGFHAGNLVWRGTFNHNSTLAVPTAVNISSSGGINYAASVWLNTHYLGAADVRATRTNNNSFPVTPDMLRDGENNVVVLHDNMGGDLSGMIVCCTPGGRARDLQQPRGIQGYYLVGRDEQFTGWKVAGNFMGEDAPDMARKIFNEGGLFAERKGWHLPGYDDSKWETRTPSEGLAGPGVGFFRTTFVLDLPRGYDIPLSFVFDSAVGQYRAQLYVNGWQMGKRIANLGPQTAFPVHEGILDYHGVNTVGLSLWALGNSTADWRIPSFKLVANGTYAGGVSHDIATNNPGWGELRGRFGVTAL